MIIASGSLSGRNGYEVRGDFLFRRQQDGQLLFETSDQFHFQDSMGGGASMPGFALHLGDPTNLPIEDVEPVVRATEFLRISRSPVSVSGMQSGALPARLDLSAFDRVFLWCNSAPLVLGVGKIERDLETS